MQNNLSDDTARWEMDDLRCDDSAKERNCVSSSTLSPEWGNKHALDDLFRGWPQVAQLSKEASRHGEHESSYNELQFAGLYGAHTLDN